MPGAKRALGELLLADDRYEDAAGVYADLLKAGQDDISVLNNLAWALTKAGRAEEAIEHAANAAAKAPSNPDVLDTYGVALLGGGQTNAAIEQFRLARAKAENRPDIALHLVEALLAAGKRAEARAVLGSINKSTLSDRERKKAENYRSQLDQ
jgi:tetratricopeptide (TPR) repeat protein